MVNSLNQEESMYYKEREMKDFGIEYQEWKELLETRKAEHKNIQSIIFSY